MRAYILCPGAVVGPTRGHVKSASTAFIRITNQIWDQAGSVFYAGEGTNEFMFVHLDDAVDYYLRAIDIATNNKDAGASSYERYFFVTSNGIKWKDAVGVITGELYRRGQVQSSEPKILKPAEVDP